jgi:F420-dependent methylenetetrahydromethanopterin dehydrogenase
MDELRARGHVAIRVLAVAGGVPARLEKAVGRQAATGSPLLEVAEMPEVAAIGMLRVREVVPRQRIAVIAEDRPVDLLVRETAEDAGTGEDLDVVVEMSL